MARGEFPSSTEENRLILFSQTIGEKLKSINYINYIDNDIIKSINNISLSSSGREGKIKLLIITIIYA